MRRNLTLVIALGASLLLHLAATGGSLGWLVTRSPADTVQFDAVLITTKGQEQIAVGIGNSRSSAPKLARKAPPPRQPTPKSEANFDAPENAIAVERTASGDASNDRAGEPAGGDKLADVAGMPDTPSPAPVALGATPVSIEAPAPQAPSPPVAETIPVVELPSRVWIAFHATTSVADGVAHYSWKREGTQYSFESTIQATGFFVEMFLGTITQKSTGEVTALGIEPSLFTIRRGDREPETAEFQRATNEVKLSRGSESRQIPMPANLQDTQSFLFQLAVEAPKLKTAEDRLTISVTNARGINRYTFKKVGEARLETRLGAVETVHLVRETSEPRDGYEAWLSPKHHYLPVKLKFFLDRFPAELIATNITSKP